MTAFSSICSGRGSWTRMPCTAGSSASFFTSASRVSCVVSAGRLMLRLSMPHWAQSLILPRTYTWLAGFSAHQNDRQAGVDALGFQCSDLLGGLGLGGGGQCLTVNNACSHDSSLFQMYFFVLAGKTVSGLTPCSIYRHTTGRRCHFSSGSVSLPGPRRRVLLPGLPGLLRPVRSPAVLPALPELRLQPLHFL